MFGVSSDEYLDYAMANRREWEARGKDVVARYVQTYKDMEGKAPDRRGSLSSRMPKADDDGGVEC